MSPGNAAVDPGGVFDRLAEGLLEDGRMRALGYGAVVAGAVAAAMAASAWMGAGPWLGGFLALLAVAGKEVLRRHRVERAYGELRGTQADRLNAARLASMGRLVTGVAHELNTPLGAIDSNRDSLRRALESLSEILADERVDEDELDEVRRIVKAVHGIQRTNEMAVDRMVHIVKTLRSFGRPDRSEVDRVDLHEGLDSTLTLLRGELEGRIEVHRDYGDLPAVECYPQRINQVFMNLLVNATHAIEGRGEITLRTRRRGESVRVEVTDTGVGIPEDHIERIFEPGFTTKGRRMGMGLGLLISRRIVERHGGSIGVESVVGEGSTVTVTLPVRMVERNRGARESTRGERSD